MKKIIFLIVLGTLFSCGNKKVVQLPEINNAKITDVLDISTVYMFYNEATDSVEFNRKNMISTTNWLVNVDKRLTLKQVLPHLQYLQDKRHGDGMHKNKNAKNYFTCHDKSINNLGFVEFTNIVYYYKDDDKDFNFGQLEDAILLDFSSNSINLEKTLEDLKQLSKSSTEFHPQKKLVILKFKDEITFQNYITVKSLLSEINIENLTLSKDEFIY